MVRPGNVVPGPYCFSGIVFGFDMAVFRSARSKLVAWSAPKNSFAGSPPGDAAAGGLSQRPGQC